MAKFALLQRQFLPKMYKIVGYLQNYPRTDKKRMRKKRGGYFIGRSGRSRSSL